MSGVHRLFRFVFQMSNYVHLAMIESFSACHRLLSKSLTDEQNRKLFGKCSNPNGHGHNCKVEVTVVGPIDPITGMVMNISDFKNLVQVRTMDVLNHKNIEQDFEYFSDKINWVENTAKSIFKQLRKQLVSERSKTSFRQLV